MENGVHGDPRSFTIIQFTCTLISILHIFPCSNYSYFCIFCTYDCDIKGNFFFFVFV